MAGVTIVLMVVGIFTRGPMVIIEGLTAGAKMFIGVLPLLIVAFLLTGFIQVLISKELVEKWFGQKAGFKGVVLGAFAGSLIPGGPYVYYPLAATLLLSGAQIGTVIAFILGKNLWNLSRIPIEVALIGPKLTFIRYSITFIFPIFVGIIANTFCKNWGEKIREQVRKMQRTGDHI